MMTTLLRRALPTILATAVVSAAAHGVEVRGRIVGDGGKPLAHAVARIVPDSKDPSKPAKATLAETGEDGGFVAQGLTGPSFRVRIEAKGYAPLTQREIPAGASVHLRLQRGATLQGIVRDRASGLPIAGATVLAWEKDAEAFGEEAYRKSKSGKDGRFVVSDLAPGKATVEARASGHAPAKSRNQEIPKAELTLLLDPASGLTGFVTDTLGDPVAGAEVKVSWRDATRATSRSAKTGADGHYRIAEARPEAVARMSVRAAKFLVATREGPAAADGVVDFVLEHGGTIAGIVRGYDGTIPPSFHVTVRVLPPASSRAKSDHQFTDPDGAFRVEDLDPGTYTIEVVADGYASLKKTELDVVAEQVADAGTLTLPSRSTLRGRAVSARDRAPVQGATVHVAQVELPERPQAGAETSWTATTAKDGTFATPALPQGTFDVVIEHPQFAAARTRVSFRPDADTEELVLEMYRGGSLTGTVLNGKLDPVQGVRIVAAQGAEGDSRVADTGPDGRYFIDGLAPGTYTVTRQQARQGSTAGLDSKLAAIREGETTTVDFDEKPRITVSGTLLKGDVPIPGASIYFVAIDGGVPRAGTPTRSDAEGGFQVGLRHGGRYQVSVVFGASATTNGNSVVTLTIPDQPEVRQDIVFNVQVISGHVVDQDRRAIKGALVTALRDGASPGDSPRQSATMTGDDGAFRLEAIDPGTYRVTARARGYAADEAYPVAVRENEADPDLDMSLQRGWMMQGRLVDPQGNGVAGALVVVAPQGAAESGYLPAQTDATGAFRITAPADGAVNVAAISPNFAPAVQTDIEQLADGNSPDVLLHATAGGALRVRVVRRGGDPVQGLQVTYQPVPLFPGCDVSVDRNRPSNTDAEGTARVALVHPGAYLVSVLGRRDVTPVRVDVNEGAETYAVLEVP